MGIDRLDKIFNPTSVAVVGASERPGSVGQAVLANIINGGFKGSIHPINARRAIVMGREAYPSLSRIDGPVDLVVIATPMETIPPIIAECARIKAAGAIIISAGGKEVGDSGRRQEALIREAALGTGLRIFGPNCLGIMCAASALNATISRRMPLDGRLAFVSQSGAICTAILDFSAKERIGFSHFIGLGSMLDVDFGDVIDYLGADPKVGSIVMYVENLCRHRNFMSAARSVSRVKPIIALKSGRSRAGAVAAASHTGAMTGEDAVYDAAFQRAGIVRVRTFEELFDAAEILSRKCRFRGPGLAILTNAGGPGVMAADALADYSMEPVRLAPETIQALDASLPEHWSHGNPVDILGDATPERYVSAAEILTQAKEVQALLVMLAPQAITDADAVAHTLARRFGDLGLPLIAAWLGGVDVERGREILNQSGIATFDTPERAIRAFMNLYRHARGVEMLQQIPPRLSNRIHVDREAAGRLIADSLASGNRLLTENESKTLIDAYGIRSNPTAVATSAEEAVFLAEDFGFPVAMKIHSRQVTHKSDIGGVLLDLKDSAAVRSGFAEMMQRMDVVLAGAEIDGVTVQPMITGQGCELIAGAKKDPDFGPVILFGMGGVLAELLDDRALALPPLNRLLASRLMENTRVDRLLRGYRHHPPANREALEAVLIRLSQLVTDFPEIVELDINPLVLSKGTPVAIDARVRLAPSSEPAPLHLAVSPYPAQYESRIQVSGLGDLLIRPIRPEDAQLLLELFDTLSSRSVYYRFFSPMKQLSPAMLARFTQIDYDREIALVAILESGSAEKMLGAARVILQHNLRDAEFSVLIGDPWQGKGIGAHLLSRCIDIARERRFGHIWGIVLAENKGMLSLGRKLNFSIRRAPQSGEFELSLNLESSTTSQSSHAAAA